MRTLSIIILLFTWSAQATLTLVQRETFQGVGTLDAGNPGNLGTVTFGNFYKRAVGPRVTGDTTANSLGWSADFEITSSTHQHIHVLTPTGVSLTNGVFSAFYIFDAIIPNASATMEINETRHANTNPQVRTYAKPASNGNFWTLSSYDFVDTDSGIAIPIRTWFELRHTWEKVSGNQYKYCLNFRGANSSSWTNILNGTFNFQNQLATIRSGELNLSGNSSAYSQARYGMPSLYSSTDLATGCTNLISDVVDPLGTATTWYLNPATGNDTNSGVAVNEAWLTPGKVNTESSYYGMFRKNSYATGDTLVIDTTSSALDLLGTPVIINTPGLNLIPAGSSILTKAYHTLTNASFSKTALLTNTYQVTDSQANVEVWEDSKWLNHVAGANWTAVKNTVDSTPGSFYADATTVYIHPIGSSNPTSDGKTYERSYVFTGGTAGASLQLLTSNLYVRGWTAQKTALISATDNTDGIATTGIVGDGNFMGTNFITQCYVDYFGKHALGVTATSTASDTTFDQCQAEQGPPTVSQTAFVSYNGGASGLNNVNRFNYCTNLLGRGVVGSTNGTSSLESYYTHNNGGSNQFSTIYFDGCSFQGLLDAANSVGNLTISNSTFAGGDINATNTTVNRSRITSRVFGGGAVGQVTTTRNSLIGFTNLFSTSLNTRTAIGTIIFEGNTIDLTSVPAGGSDDVNGGYWKRTGALTLTARNNVFLIGPSATWTIIQNATTNDSLTLSNNVYYLGATNLIAKSYDGTNRTFAQWQALGYDANTSTNNPYLRSDYRPQPWSPVRNAGVNIGPLIDYSGKKWQVRKDIGAYQWDILNQPFSMGIQQLTP